MFRKFYVGLVLLVGSALATLAFAQDYPTRTIRFVVPNSAGTAHDAMARIFAQEMSKILGQAIIVDNKPGASNLIGYEYVAKQVPPDGYTVSIGVAGQLATLPLLFKELRFDPLKDLPPVIALAEGRLLLASAPTVPWNTFTEMVSWGKANPGKLNYGTSGATIRLQTAALMQNLGIDAIQIPYSTGALFTSGILAGDAHIGFIAEGQAVALGPKVRILALTGQSRSDSYPAVPTFAELGQPQVPGSTYTLNVPAATPKAVTEKLYSAAAKALQSADVRSQLAKIYLVVVEPTSETKRLADMAASFAEIAKKVGLEPQ